MAVEKTVPAVAAAAAAETTKTVAPPAAAAPVVTPAPVETRAPLVVSTKEQVRAAVHEGVVYVYGQVNGVLVVVRTRATEVTEAVKKQAVAVMQLAQVQLTKAEGSVRNSMLLVDAKVKAGALQIKTQGLTLQAAASKKAFEGLEVVQQQVQRVPVPAKLQDGAVFVRTKTGDAVVFVKGGCLRVVSKVDDVVVVVKAKAVRSYDGAREQVEMILDTASKTVEQRRSQLKDGLVVVQGKVDNLVVRMKSRTAEGQAYLTDAMLRCKAALDELAVTKMLKNGATVVFDKVNNVTLYVKDGYLHAAAKIDNGVVLVKAQLTQTTMTARTRVVETYVALEAAAHSTADSVVKKALSTYDVTKASTLAVAEKAKVQADALKTRSQAFAAEKPVTASSASGAALGGAGGGLAGLATGAVAGAAAGLPLALFTFGLSVPVGAVLGGSTGVAVGATVGSTAGAVSGAAVGYGYEKRDTINQGIDSAKARAVACSSYVKDTAVSSSNVLANKFRRSAEAGA